MARLLVLLIALFAFASPAGAARKTSEKMKPSVRTDAIVKKTQKEPLYKCVWENYYRDPDETERVLVFQKGLPATDEKQISCNVACTKLRYTKAKDIDGVTNENILAYEAQFVYDIKPENEMIDKDKKTCTCTRKDGKQLVPTYRNTHRCNPAHCWMFHKKIFGVEKKGDPWRMKDISCKEECPQGEECDITTIANTADDVLQKYQDLKSKYDAWLELGGKKSNEPNPLQHLSSDTMDFIKQMQDPTPEAEWRMKEDARCSKPCNDGDVQKPYKVDAWACYQGDKRVDDEECEKVEKVKPDTLIECPFLAECRVAWSTKRIDPNQGAVARGHELLLDLDGPWQEVGKQLWDGLTISETTGSTALVSLKKDLDSSFDVRQVTIRNGNTLSYTTLEDVQVTGTYDGGKGTITWDDGIEWKRRSNENIPSLFDGVWMDKDYMSVAGHLEVQSEKGTLTTTSEDGFPEKTERNLAISGNTIHRPGSDEVGTLEWDKETQADKITWRRSNDPSSISSVWVRQSQPTVSTTSWSPCSQNCIPEGEEARGKQVREVECLVEKGGQYRGMWTKTSEHVCEKLEKPKPLTRRECQPVPPQCGNWEVVCRNKNGEIGNDDECQGDKPKLA